MYSNYKSKWPIDNSEEENWEFFTDQHGKWRWIKTDADGITVSSSAASFDMIDDCILNALLYGYYGNMDAILFIPHQFEMELITVE